MKEYPCYPQDFPTPTLNKRPSSVNIYDEEAIWRTPRIKTKNLKPWRFGQ